MSFFHKLLQSTSFGSPLDIVRDTDCVGMCSRVNDKTMRARRDAEKTILRVVDSTLAHQLDCWLARVCVLRVQKERKYKNTDTLARSHETTRDHQIK